jgi:N-acylneuraminate cytidylyltransferase
MTPLVIVPARAGSKGVPNKNFKELPDGSTLLSRAVDIGLHLGGLVAISSDADIDAVCDAVSLAASTSTNVKGIRRPAALAQDDTPMRDVVEHVLAQVPGEPDQPIVLLQPTTPLRTVKQVKACLDELRGQSCGVATVKAIPEKYWRARHISAFANDAVRMVPRRQDATPLYLLSGTAYCWMRGNGWPTHWEAVLDRDEPYVNVDTPDDWDALCAIIRRQVADR